MTMPTPAEEAALSTFIDAATSDDDLGYPHGTAFIPCAKSTGLPVRPSASAGSWRLRRGNDAADRGTVGSIALS